MAIRIGIAVSRRTLDATETNDFCELVVERYRQGSLVIESNRDASEFLVHMADPLLAKLVVDRIQSAAYELIIEGESHLKRQKATDPIILVVGDTNADPSTGHELRPVK